MNQNVDYNEPIDGDDDFEESYDLSGETAETARAAKSFGLPDGDYHAEIQKVELEKKEYDGEVKRNIKFTFAALAGVLIENGKRSPMPDKLLGQLQVERLSCSPESQWRRQMFAVRLGLAKAGEQKSLKFSDWEATAGQQVIISVVNGSFKGDKGEIKTCKLRPDGVHELDDPDMAHVPLDWPSVDAIGMTDAVKRARAQVAKPSTAKPTAAKPAVGKPAAPKPAPAIKRPARPADM